MSISMIKKPLFQKDKYFGSKMSRSIDVDSTPNQKNTFKQLRLSTNVYPLNGVGSLVAKPNIQLQFDQDM